MNDKYVRGAILGGLVAGLGITAIMMAGEKKSGKPSELIDLERAGAQKLDIVTPEASMMPTATEQVIAQGGHLLLSAAAGAVYAAASDEDTDPVVGGVLFGLSFYALAHWLTGPALGLKKPEWTSDRKTIGMHTINHVVFGLVTAFSARGATRV